MQEVRGSNPRSSTGQKNNSNGPNTEYSSKVQQRRQISRRTSVRIRSQGGVSVGRELRAV